MKTVQLETMGIRSILSWMLARLSSLAIKKHGMKFIVVAGEHGTKLTGELIADMISPDYVVRRQLEKPFWDFSIPLVILGFEDKQYSIFGWMVIVIKSFFRLLIGRSNFTWTILQMNTYKRDIAAYWARIIEPEILVLVHIDAELRELEKMIIKKTGKCIVAPYHVIDSNMKDLRPSAETISVGECSECDVFVKRYEEVEKGTEIEAVYKASGEKMKLFSFQKGNFMREPLELAIGVLLVFDFTVQEISEKLLQSQLDVERFIFTAPKKA